MRTLGFTSTSFGGTPPFIQSSGVDPSDLIVHAVGGCRSETLDYSQDPRCCRSERGSLRSNAHLTATRSQEPWTWRAWASKGLAGSHRYRHRGPRRSPNHWISAPNSVASKPVGRPHPSLAVLQTVFTTAELPLPACGRWTRSPACPLRGNGNGGLYLGPRYQFSPLSPKRGNGGPAGCWSGPTCWDSWYSQRRSGVHGHGASRARASIPQQTGRSVELTRPMKRNSSAISARPQSIHYHQRAMDAKGLASPHRVRRPSIARSTVANAAITEARREASPVATFWDWRYATNPSLGTGHGQAGGSPWWRSESSCRPSWEVLQPRSPCSTWGAAMAR